MSHIKGLMTPSELLCFPLATGPQNEENCPAKSAYKYCVFIIMAHSVSDNASIVLATQLPVTHSRLFW